MHPDQHIKVGFFRSQYHEFGLNSVLTNNNLSNLYEIFGLSRLTKGKNIKPDFDLAYNNVRSAISRIKELDKLAINTKSHGKFILDLENGEGETYIQSLEVVQETIEYVLSQKNKEEFEMHWNP
jgi:hypothetical protein